MRKQIYFQSYCAYERLLQFHGGDICDFKEQNTVKKKKKKLFFSLQFISNHIAMVVIFLFLILKGIIFLLDFINSCVLEALEKWVWK
jgi:hypothetical protein